MELLVVGWPSASEPTLILHLSIFDVRCIIFNILQSDSAYFSTILIVLFHFLLLFSNTSQFFSNAFVWLNGLHGFSLTCVTKWQSLFAFISAFDIVFPIVLIFTEFGKFVTFSWWVFAVMLLINWTVAARYSYVGTAELKHTLFARVSYLSQFFVLLWYFNLH